jgi:ribose transport system ATP-binding protein
MNNSQSCLEIRNVSKSFPGVRALDDVSLSFYPGQVHALLGENGAGKSTLIKILSGAQLQDSGAILVDGTGVEHLTPRKALQIGISTIYQEFNLIPELTVAENIFYGREDTTGPFLDKKRMNAEARALCDGIGVSIDPGSPVRRLGVAQQQIVEIVKAVSHDSRVLIMDEPTAPLTNQEIELLFGLIRQLKQRQTSVIFITHRLEEVFEICDMVSVLRDGKHISTAPTSEVNKDTLIKWMVGRSLDGTFPKRSGRTGKPVLKVRDLSSQGIRSVSLDLHEGEILGIAGLVGSGRTSLARAIFGADQLYGGRIEVADKEVLCRSPEDAINAGIGLLPEDRKQHGVILGFPIFQNVSYAALDTYVSHGFIRKTSETADADAAVSRLGIRTPSARTITSSLSGGNQQKVVLAKWLATRCNILIFDEPTRGIDVGAKAEIYNLLVELTERGKSIIMISSEMIELIGMADRILVMNDGWLVGELDRKDYDQHTILEMASRSIHAQSNNEEKLHAGE